MRKMFALFVLLFLFGCTNEENKTFEFTGEIQKIIVTGRGTHAEANTQEIENAADINIMENAIQNATILSERYTNEGPLYHLEVIYEDTSKESIDLWYVTSTKKGRFYTNEEMYSLNEGAIPALIELVESYGGIK